ncbi:uncharacterized protein LOC129963840 [Argiope bruennichi]|uniref:uncharacterized protein LOC129963840 n=1 Tax=Argiope bruennichi TaxID=94029 RepID=UPI002494AE0C|nr:uncharacterized protein LOC129963840 [Argiope bruennichi]
MHFSVFIVFQIVLFIGFQSVQAGDEKMEKVRKVMCDDEYQDVRDEMLDCAGKADLSKYEDLVMPCADGLESMEPAKMREFWCSKSEEEIKGIQNCVDGNVQQSGKEDEIKKEGEPIAQCLEEKFGSERRK